MLGINEKVAIVTGGASGLGAGIVRSMVAAGVCVVVADILGKEGALLENELGRNCLFHRTDLTVDSDLDSLLQKCVDRFGGVDFLVNVACSYIDKGVESQRREWHAGFDVNVIGHVMLLQRALPYLKKSSSPSVVNFTSASGHIAQAQRWVYPATKAAIEQVTRSAALDLAEFGIRVNSVLPGLTAKYEQNSAPAEAKRRIESLASRLHMIARPGAPQEVADAVLFLCSDHAKFMTGSCLTVDGGYTSLGPQGREVHVPSRVRPTDQTEH
jgi:NAD(P)-dependent dehydrogenase (short-subunit alcohol dehydrogenase family)